VVDVRSDAPAGAHGEVRKRAVSVALGALAQIIPDRVSGDLCGTSFPNSIGGYNHRRERQYVYYEAPAGGNGGFAGADGSSAFANVDFGNIRTIQTAESIENEMPLLVERCELRADSGGEGAHRGGLGLHREIRVLGEEGSYSVLSDRAAIPPFGVAGGTSSRSYRVAVRRNGTENDFPTPCKVTGHPVRQDDVVIMQSAGGGGYGDPLDRDPEAVLADVLAGFVSAERAREGYGVVLDAAGDVDGEATAAARDASRRTRLRLAVRADEADPYTGVRGRRRTVRLAPAIAERLGVTDDDLMELLGAHPAPLRAWVRVEAGETDAGGLGLDEFGRRVLGVEAGDEVVLRRIAQPRPPGGMAHPCE
jgi:N-methylhydantoinase B